MTSANADPLAQRLQFLPRSLAEANIFVRTAAQTLERKVRWERSERP